MRAPPPSAESSSETAAYASVVPISSPTSSESHQHIEFSSPAVVYKEPEEQQHIAPAPQGPAPSQPVVTPSPANPDGTEPPPPALPERPTVSPASADYDWATHNLQGGPLTPPPPPPPTPPPAVEPQYHVHPQHLSRQPFSEVPPVQAVPVPTYERDSPMAAAPPSPSAPSLPSLRAESPKPSGGKEKKSGWARLGLGRDDDKGRKKGRSASSSSAKDDSKESSSSGFLGGLFGRKHREEHDRPPPRTQAPSPPPEPKIPPPPPTASGVLLPNGRYANFYRLPIHVERAVYRLSHIKLANPRRPLYEQVLISNLMCTYLLRLCVFSGLRLTVLSRLQSGTSA